MFHPETFYFGSTIYKYWKVQAKVMAALWAMGKLITGITGLFLPLTTG